MLVKDLILNFRLSLIDMVPRFDFIDSPWKMPEASDEWDHLAQAIYEAIVVEPLRSSLPEEDWEQFRTPKYETWVDLSEMSIIEVLSPSDHSDTRAFVYLSTDKELFDTVGWVSTTKLIDKDGSRQTGKCNLQDARFLFRRNIGGKWIEGVENLIIPSGYHGRPPI